MLKPALELVQRGLEAMTHRPRWLYAQIWLAWYHWRVASYQEKETANWCNNMDTARGFWKRFTQGIHPLSRYDIICDRYWRKKVGR